ncbi:MAG: hypothetical protein LVS60_01165 [Nodosilinea sp. LVE1205-7]|jgi:hypothetical protein
MAVIAVCSHLQTDLALFQASDVDARLRMIWQAHQSVGQALATSLPVALFSQSVQLLVRQLNQISQDDQRAVVRDILAGSDTRFTQAYRRLNVNMKMIFWHRLLTGKRIDFWLSYGSLTSDHGDLLDRLNRIDLSERLDFLRGALA